MPTYRIDLPQSGIAIFQPLETDTVEIQLQISSGYKELNSLIREYGVKALLVHPQFSTSALEKVIGDRHLIVDHKIQNNYHLYTLR